MASLGVKMRWREWAGPPLPPRNLYMVLLVALQPREDLDKGHMASVHLGTLKGRAGDTIRDDPGAQWAKEYPIVPPGPMGVPRPHRTLMSQGPTGSWTYQGPVNPCQAFQSLYANVAQSRKRLLNQSHEINVIWPPYWQVCNY